jgi:UDP:flavonoid glycosyltransferase YjiC (YdhE family)
VVTDGTWGDVGPFVGIATSLRARGHEVHALLNPSFADAARRSGLSVDEVGVSWKERLPYGDARRLLRPISGTIHVLRELVVPELPRWIDATRTALARFRPDAALLHHLAWGSLAPVHAAGVPLAAAFLAPAVLQSSLDPPRMIPGLPAPPSPVQRAMSPMIRALFRRVLDAPAATHFANAGFDPPRDLLGLAERVAARPLALWSRHLREPVADDPPRLHTCGFAFPPEPEALDPRLEAFLAAGPPPVVVTLGTTAREMGLPLYEAAAEACARIGRRAVLLCGGPDNTPAKLPPGVLAIDEAPHGRLMPRACAIVHHGGAGTLAQALRSGRPAVIVPFGHDQADNAYLAARIGTARVLRRGRADPARLARALEAVLAQEVVDAAERIGARVRAEDGATAAAEHVESLGAR